MAATPCSRPDIGGGLLLDECMADTTSPVSEIPEDSAWGYLASVEVGRIAVSAGDLPEIFPVNFCLDGESIVFRSAPGTKLEKLAINEHVVFEADGWNEEGGWSVVVKGLGALITDEEELARVKRAPLLPWIPTVKRNWVRITPNRITGRAFFFGPEPAQD
ncbi:Nitroimidazol reductase NimA, pyridoxamine 5'-phosphate oxidase superfamily [Propionibacterium cyclohexanicum]|uniref:Nitroimidazol reductase NimA, pyridoxamine 5'-phosphate oxidase superfamily n=2 Tax=Propionibacterium cyclohexanicum TaxID=64702 RepID=A0A1H9PP89_9ACTN|nr:Nitroimidazol reductase NimA, pyridoxamine 5'-phosphate oxidase superfamily [Propionibacterium cyclohexanicum]